MALPTTNPRTTLQRCVSLGLAVIAAMFVVVSDAPAQDAAGGFDGRGFAGVDLPQPVESYELSFSGVRANTWREDGAARIYLQRGVKVRIGLYRFEAETATVWLEPIEIDGRDAQQVAVYMTEVVSPAQRFGISQESESLLVTAVTYEVRTALRVDDRRDGRPAGGVEAEDVSRAEARFGRHLASVAREGDERALVRRDGSGETGRPATGGATVEATERPAWLDVEPRDAVVIEDQPGLIEPNDRGSVVFDGTDISYRAARGDGVGPTVILEGGFVIQYRVPDRRQGVVLRADRAVVFLDGSSEPGLRSYEIGDVLGVYMEGGVRVEAEGQSLSARRVYYDLAREQGVIIDGVFRVRDDGLGQPITFRAETVRQLSLDQWSARDVQLANVSFAEPHFAIGATDITITRQPAEGGTRTFVDAEGVSFDVNGSPLLTLPRMKGEVKATPLRRAEAGREANSAVLRTEWDLYTLLGVDGPERTDASLLLDGYFERGVGVGTDFEWDTRDFTGELFAYYAYTDGEDELTSGADLEPESEHRGIVLGENVWRIDQKWTLFAETSYLSDPTFVDAFFENQAEERREFTNSLRIRSLEENSVFSIEARSPFNDFIANEYLLQSLGYQTERLPEARYSRFADNLFGGLVSWSSDTRAGLVRLNFNEVSAEEQGFDTVRRARAAFGLLPTESIADRLRAAGLSEREVARFDTRHEIEIPLTAGPFNVVPFAVGRFTAYDDDFDDFAGRDNDPYRLWGSAGVRASTSLQRVYEGFESEFFGAHGLRHIIEPEATLWHASSSIRQEDLPIYDDGVESLADGTSVNVAVTNTFQTKRGMPGRRRSVDWITMRSGYTWSSEDVDPESPFGVFTSYRPEHSNLGNYFRNETVWNVTDALTLINDILIDTDEGRVARNVIGADLSHGAFLTTFAEYRELDPIDSAQLRVGGRHELTRKYAVGLAGTYDFDDEEFQSVSAFVTRRFPQWTVDMAIDLDRITESVGVSLSLRPVGFGNERRTRAFVSGLTPAESVSSLRTGRGRIDKGPFGER